MKTLELWPSLKKKRVNFYRSPIVIYHWKTSSRLYRPLPALAVADKWPCTMTNQSEEKAINVGNKTTNVTVFWSSIKRQIKFRNSYSACHRRRDKGNRQRPTESARHHVMALPLQSKSTTVFFSPLLPPSSSELHCNNVQFLSLSPLHQQVTSPWNRLWIEINWIGHWIWVVPFFVPTRTLIRFET